MTQEQKAQAYDRALERVKNIKTGKCETTFIFTVGLFEYIFPELAESKDERIRRELIKETKGSEERLFETVTNEEFIAWLEKQCQVKESPISQHEDKTCKENSNSLTGEDEKIRKALLEMVHDTTGDELWVDYNIHKEEALAWLEKQGEQILADSAKTCKDGQKQALIDKACEWLSNNIAHYTDTQNDSEGYLCEVILEDALIGDFRKAMEGEENNE